MKEEIARRRAGGRAYDEGDLSFLEGMNDALQDFERSLLREVEEEYPTIWILGREDKVLKGHETTVTHFKIKTGIGHVQEWRTSENVMLKSIWKTPIGKIVIKLTKVVG